MLIIKRDLLEELKKHAEKPEISLITGPRQAGKTTVMMQLKAHLEQGGHKTLFLSLDNEMDRQFFSSQSSLVRKIELELGNKRGFVFIDEIQRKESAGVFLKGIYDMGLPYKLIVSGSGSLELKEKIHESLVGRKLIFQLDTVSFKEFVNFKTDYRYEDKLSDFFDVEREKGEALLEEYLGLGGYPRVVIEEKLEDKRRIIDDIYTSYLEKDISYLLKVDRADAFSHLVRVLAGQTGRLVNYSELSSSVGIALQTLKNYLWYGEQTFVVNILTPFFRNPKKELSKSPVAYFYDLGLRNYCLNMFGNVTNPVESGFIFQNFIFNVLRAKTAASGSRLHFWRTKDKAEVDFVIDHGRELVPFEVKYKKMKDAQVERPMRSFIEKYEPTTAFVVNRSLDQTMTIGKTLVTFMPFWRLL